MDERPHVIWIGEGAPPGLSGRVRVETRAWSDPPVVDADLMVLSPAPEWLTGPHREALARLDIPKVLFGPSLSEEQIRQGINAFGVFHVLGRSTADDIEAAWSAARERGERRRERMAMLLQSSQRTRELERLTEELEGLISERTRSLEQSMREEKAKLARERQLIRFLSEIASLNSVEEILRVLRREVRPIHAVQGVFVAVGEPGRGFHLSCSRGDRVLRSETPEDLSRDLTDERRLRQMLADRLGRPFNRLIAVPLPIRSPGQGVFGVEHSQLSEAAAVEVTGLLQERSQATGMFVERVWLEESLRRFATRWERTFDGFRDPICVMDVERKVQRANRQFSRRSGGQCHQVFAGRDAPCEGCPVIADPTRADLLEAVVHRDRRIYRLRSWPVRADGSGPVIGRVTAYEDVTESRELSLRMIQSEKMRAVGQLAGHIAHELNNPLTGIRSLAQVLGAEWPDGPIHDDLAQIENAARRCQTIIRHLLGFTQPGTGPLEPVQIDEVVEMTLPLLKTALRRHRQRLILTTRPRRIRADAHLLQQVVFNLVNNACQAMAEPGTVEIATNVVQNDGRAWVELRVSDTGPGLAPEIRSRLFEPFVTTKKEGEGTGLGLSTSKAIVDRQGGTIEASSEPGQGATFLVRFPVMEDS